MSQTQMQPRSQSGALKALLGESLTRVSAAMPKHMTPERCLSVAMLAIQRQPKLLECSPYSVAAAVVQGSVLGLSFDPGLGEAHIVPFWNGKSRKFEATFIAGYKGFLRLAYRGGEIRFIDARVVYEGDQFDLEYGSQPKLTHRPAFPRKKNAGIVGAYCVAHYRDGNSQIEFMPIEDIELVRLRSKAKDSPMSPWNDREIGFAEMAKKTVIRRAFKSWVVSTDAVKLAEEDEREEMGLKRVLSEEIREAIPDAPPEEIDGGTEEPAALPAESSAEPMEVPQEPAREPVPAKRTLKDVTAKIAPPAQQSTLLPDSSAPTQDDYLAAQGRLLDVIQKKKLHVRQTERGEVREPLGACLARLVKEVAGVTVPDRPPAFPEDLAVLIGALKDTTAAYQ